MATEFGSRLRAAYKHSGKTQKQIAKEVGMGQGTLSDLMKEGRGSVFAMQLAHACGVNPDWLVTGTGAMLPPPAPVPSATAPAPAAPAEMSLGQTLARLGEELGRASPQTRAAVADLLSRYAQNPAQGQSLAQAIEMLVRSDTNKEADA